MRSPHVLQLIMDSLRYWVTEMHVDGFRFDLAATLARQFHEVDRLSSFFDLVQQDPVVSRVKLIAEPWDVGEGGYQVGNFPPLWTEWNGRYRDTVREMWRGEPGTLAEFASRLTGSSDLYRHGRRPLASINFVTCHDGFTLHDLVSYDGKHNEANGEGNRDGENHNRSWNCGTEGATDDPDVLRLRRRQMRNFVATLMLSQGVPMISHGDEFARTQHGNNNAYCQDSELTWMRWPDGDADERELRPEGELCAFIAEMAALRSEHPVFRRRRFFRGPAAESTGEERRRAADIAWFTPQGEAMRQQDWHEEGSHSLTVLLNGDAISEPGIRGEPVTDDSFLLLFNSRNTAVDFTVPDGPEGWAADSGGQWQLVLDTADELPPSAQEPRKAGTGDRITLTDRSLVVLRCVRTGAAAPGRAAATGRA